MAGLTERVGLSSASGFNSCFSDTVFVTLLRTAIETAISEVHKLLRTGGVPTSLTLLSWRCIPIKDSKERLFVMTQAHRQCPGGGRRSLRSLRVGALGRAVHLYPSLPPPFPIPNKPYGFCGRIAPCLLT